MMVDKVTFEDFRGSDCPNRLRPWISPCWWHM